QVQHEDDTGKPCRPLPTASMPRRRGGSRSRFHAVSPRKLRARVSGLESLPATCASRGASTPPQSPTGPHLALSDSLPEFEFIRTQSGGYWTLVQSSGTGGTGGSLSGLSPPDRNRRRGGGVLSMTFCQYLRSFPLVMRQSTGFPRFPELPLKPTRDCG